MKKTQRTQNRHSLHSLGGYLIDQLSYEDEPETSTAMKLLEEQLSEFEGPLIFHDNESYQREVDTTCKKLYKHLFS